MSSYWLISNKVIFTGMPKTTSLEDIEVLLLCREEHETAKESS